MFKEDLENKTKEEILDLIRFELALGGAKDERLRFGMTGFDEETVGDCVVSNLNIVNRFADLGIYVDVEYLFLKFYKGTGRLYYRYTRGTENHEEELSGYTTSEIIFRILKATIFTSRDEQGKL